MIKSSSKNGIRVEKDIELVMKNAGNTPWYDYLLQYVILAAISISIFYCLSSGLSLEVDNGHAILILGLMVAYFMVLYSFRSIFKYSGIITFFLYVMFGYINLEQLQSGYAQVYNTFIDLYNDYFNASAGTAVVQNTSYQNGREFFLLFLMVIVVAVVCYIGMYGKSMFVYVVITAPIVYLSFIVGFTPATKPYLVYIIGTVALFTGTIVEKYGLFSKANRITIGQFVIHTLERARVRAQIISVIGLSILFSMIYFWYSPERYEREFNATEIKTEVQNKIKQITSSDLLKDTTLGKLTENMETESNSGMSNGRLGRISSIKYDHTTALKVTTEKSNINQDLYLKGFVGEVYSGDSWHSLSKMDQSRVNSVNEALVTGTNVELINQVFLKQYIKGLYPYFTAERFSINVEKIGADSSCDYIPYNSNQRYELYDGKIRKDGDDDSYLMFDLTANRGGLTYYENFLKYAKFSSLLQLNVLNSKVIEENLQKPLNQIEESDLKNGKVSSLDVLNGISLRSIDGTTPDNEDKKVGFVGQTYGVDTFDACSRILQYADFAKDENKYFDLAQQIYTKLPDEGLDRVKDLVKDRKVTFTRTLTDGRYDRMDQVDTTAYAKTLYEKYKGSLDINVNELESNEFSYNELTNQDKIFDAVSFVKDYLEKNTTYTLSPGKTPEDKDYVENFLFDKKKGYCMHYASAATVMLRAMGVPARYAEGYVVTEEDFQKATDIGTTSCPKYSGSEEITQDEEQVVVDVQDTNAHAWVEVYLPGYGWTPIEVTSPYSDGNSIEIPPVNRDPNATLKPTRKPTATPAATPTPTSKVQPTASAAGTQTMAPTAVSEKHTSFIDGIKNWYRGLSSTVRRTIQVVLSLILVLAASIIVILARRKVLFMIFARGMRKRACNERILYAYREMARLTSRQMPEYSTDMPYTDYAKLFVVSYPFIKEEDAAIYFSILLKAKFGMAKIDPEEEHLAMAFYRSFVKTVEENLGLWSRLYYKYIFVLRR